MDQYNHIKNIKICFLISIKILQYKLRSCLPKFFYPEYFSAKHFYVFLDSPYARSLVPIFFFLGCVPDKMYWTRWKLGNYVLFLSNHENVFDLPTIAHCTIIIVKNKKVLYIWSFHEVTTAVVTIEVLPFHKRTIVKIRLLFKRFVFRTNSLP